MINGMINELEYYLPECIKNQVMAYIRGINENSEDGYTSIMDDRVYGRVMAYDTIPKQKGKIEAHNRYVDIQVSILGAEGIEVYQRKDLDIVQEYDPEADVAFYKYNGNGHVASIENIPGRFTMLFPEDAHQPKMRISEAYGHVKKFVVKIDKSLFE